MRTGGWILRATSMAALSALFACSSGGGGTPPGPTFSNSNLKGTYTFLAAGNDIYGPSPDNYEVGGVLVADGSGAVTMGEQTYSSQVGAYSDSFTGTYSISSSGLGTITLNTGDTAIGVSGTETFSVVLLSGSKALISQFDTSATSSGTLDLQTSTAMPTGGYAFSVVGGTFNGVVAFGGVFNIDNDPSTGSISGAGSVVDIVKPTYSLLDQLLAGTVSVPDSFGKVSIQLAAGSPPQGINFDGYITDSTHMQLVENDTFGVTGGTAIGQGSATGTFTTDAAFAGTFVYSFYGFTQSGYGTDAGVITADGASALSNGQIDQDHGGNVISDTLSGSYSIDAAGTGRVSATTTFGSNGAGPTLIFYLTGAGNPVPVLQVDTTALAAGTAYLQGSGAASFNGAYGVGFTSPQFSGEKDVTAQIVAKSSDGTLAGTANINAAFVPMATQTFDGTFSSGSGGRFTGTITTNGFSADCSFYFVDSTQAVLIETDGNRASLGSIRQQVGP